MRPPQYETRSTALVFVDPYNDFLSEGGKIWERLRPVAEKVGLIENLKSIVHAVRSAGMRVIYAPHRRWAPGDYDAWAHANPTQRAIMHRHSFARGEWGGDWRAEFAPQPGDIVAKEHWAQSGFANTDLDLQLRQHGITHVILVGLLANTCIESTGRYAMELGYHVTLVRDATAAYSDEMMHVQSRLVSSPHLSTRQYARIVQGWVRSIGLNPATYGTHSLRRTKAALIYRKTGNLRAVQLLLGHSKLESTVRYLGVEVDDAIAISESVDL